MRVSSSRSVFSVYETVGLVGLQKATTRSRSSTYALDRGPNSITTEDERVCQRRRVYHQRVESAGVRLSSSSYRHRRRRLCASVSAKRCSGRTSWIGARQPVVVVGVSSSDCVLSAASNRFVTSCSFIVNSRRSFASSPSSSFSFVFNHASRVNKSNTFANCFASFWRVCRHRRHRRRRRERRRMPWMARTLSVRSGVSTTAARSVSSRRRRDHKSRRHL